MASNFTADIDIDLPSDFKPEALFPDAVRASMVVNGRLQHHPCGVYFQKVPRDPVTRLAAVPYAEAEEIGYAKIDFLHLSLLGKFATREEIEALLDVDPDWGLLKIPSVVKKLFQLGNHFELVDKVRPTSIMELADVIAMTKPGKRWLLDAYLRDRARTRPEIYVQREGSYGYKKSHAIAYAMNVALQLHLVACGVEL